MQQLSVQSISIAYQSQIAVDNVSFGLETGEVGCLLGPSGCGKTSILRAIAGFEPIMTGSIKLGNLDLASPKHHLPPQNRQVGMVFQDFALYPHLNVWDNVAFGIAHQDKKNQQKRIQFLLDLVELSAFKDRYPHELSGGQQQRVALIRAMAPEPGLLLLDEPFSNMDITLRQTLASELRLILKQSGITSILVTHDQSEAYAMADNIGVMNQGKLIQWGSAFELYQTPKTAFVADFIGEGVLLKASTLSNQTAKTIMGEVSINQPYQSNREIKVLVRPEDVNISQVGEYTAKVINRLFMGGQMLYTLLLPNHEKLLCYSPTTPEFQLDDVVGVTLLNNQFQAFESA